MEYLLYWGWVVLPWALFVGLVYYFDEVHGEMSNNAEEVAVNIGAISLLISVVVTIIFFIVGFVFTFNKSSTYERVEKVIDAESYIIAIDKNGIDRKSYELKYFKNKDNLCIEHTTETTRYGFDINHNWLCICPKGVE
jgi:hypothetical protein